MMKKLQLFILLLSLIASRQIISSPASEVWEQFSYFTTGLLGTTISIYGSGKLLKSTSGIIQNVQKQKNFLRAANVLLKTSSALKVPCFWFSLITISGIYNN